MRIGMYADECPVYHFVDPDDKVFADKVLDVEEDLALRWKTISEAFWMMQHELRKLNHFD